VPIESFLDKERDNGENWVFYTVVRMQGNLGEARSLLQKTLEQATPGDTHFQIVSAQEQVDRFLYPYQALAAIGAFLGILALLLTASGVFGMLSYLVTQRRKEFGVRIALGARGLHVLLMMLWQALRLTAAGAALGALSAFAVAHIASHYMHQLNFFDLGGYAAGILIIIVTAIIASWIPATRAVCVDPANALRCD
jgi:ABC-type antimicrobial peptide transport system permease subunit